MLEAVERLAAARRVRINGPDKQRRREFGVAEFQPLRTEPRHGQAAETMVSGHLLRDDCRKRRREWAPGRSPSRGVPEQLGVGAERRQHVQDTRANNALLRFPADARDSLPETAWSVNTLPVERQRILRGWTPAQLARVAHMDTGIVRSLVAGQRRPSLGAVQALCNTLGLQLSDVIVFRDAPGGVLESSGLRSNR